MSDLPGRALRSVYGRLRRAYGAQHWWPGETPFEIMVGAILTQNTAWANVERAIVNLQADGRLDPEAIVRTPHNCLARLLRPSGYFNIKARRLRNFCKWYRDEGGFGGLQRRPTEGLRDGLLSVNGIGPETADDMLLYAFERPVFVIDAYTRRIFARLGLVGGREPYEVLRAGIQRALRRDVILYNEYHALIVRHGKDVCRKRPRCGRCCLEDVCTAGARDEPGAPPQ